MKERRAIVKIVDSCSSSIACRLWLISILLLSAFPLAVQAEDRNDGALWTVNQIAVPLDERFAAHLMVQNRWVDNLDSYQRTVIRPWLSFDWTDQVELALGYDHHEFVEPRHAYEDRAWQRIAYRHKLGESTLLTHFWMEERFFQVSTTVAFRARFLIGVAHPLPADFGLVVRNEFFVDLHGTAIVRRAGLGEDQFYAGINHPLGRFVNLDMGYLMNYLDRNGPDPFNHALVIGLSFKTPEIGDWL
jgi:hypothetical protein